MQINKDTLSALIDRNMSDKENLDFIFHCLMDFEDYHCAVFEMECKESLYSPGVLGRDNYRYMLSSADKNRTMAHNNLLGKVNALNRLAANYELPPLYDGVVSEDRPYRREVADAVFEYVQSVIENRV